MHVQWGGGLNPSNPLSAYATGTKNFIIDIHYNSFVTCKS